MNIAKSSPRLINVYTSRYGHSWLALRAWQALGTIHPAAFNVIIGFEPFLVAPLQPTELYEMVFTSQNLLTKSERRDLAQALGLNDLKAHLQATVPDFEAQLRIDRRCRAFAERLLAREQQGPLTTQEEQDLAKLRRIAGATHSTVRWIEDVLAVSTSRQPKGSHPAAPVRA